MFKERKLTRLLAIAVTLAMYSFMTQSVAARGGGHGGGGHHASHHGGEHNHHPYHPSHHHEEHHASHHGDHHDDHHHVAHHNHHRENWHHGDWGPGFWGGAALDYGYAGWDGYGYGGGDTYVDNSTNVTPASNESASDDDANASDDSANSSDDESSTANDGANRGFPTDDWPELGVVTYAGQYGASQGQVIVRVVPGSAAAKAGLVPGDVILLFNGQPVPSADDLDSAFDTANGKFEVQVWDARTGRKSTVTGALDPAAAPPTNETTAFAPAQQ